MTINEKTIRLICELEQHIGSNCYNPNSYDGYNDEYGREMRYPVCLKIKEDGEEYKIKGNIASRIHDFTPEVFHTMKYKFGSNHLYIGLGIAELMTALEERYGLDFEQLENKKINK